MSSIVAPDCAGNVEAFGSFRGTRGTFVAPACSTPDNGGMRFGITSKLFIAILATNIITALAVGLGARAAFESGFDSYLREREDMRLTRLARVLANAYDENHGWDFLRGNDAMWVELNHTVRPQPGELGPPPPGERRHPAPSGVGGHRPERGPRPDRVPPSMVTDTAGRVVAGRSDDRTGRMATGAGRVHAWNLCGIRHSVGESNRVVDVMDVPAGHAEVSLDIGRRKREGVGDEI